jgi:hypothetical protein
MTRDNQVEELDKINHYLIHINLLLEMELLFLNAILFDLN